MRVVRATRFGGPEVLEVAEAPDPVAVPGKVVVEVSFADVIALDTALRSSEGSEFFGLEPPFVPGTGVAGKVISVGEGVDAAWIGRRVVAITGVSGGYAERAVIPEGELIEIPDGLGFDEATALINDGRTALALMEGGNVKPGEWVLVMPAGSGLGVLLVQLARTADARVIAAARGAAKLDLARESGAEVAVDYSEEDWIGHVREAVVESGIHVVFDGIGGQIGRVAFEMTARGGRFSGFGASSGSYVDYDEDEAGERGVRVLSPELVHIGGTEKAKRLAEKALSEAATGKIKPHIGQTFPLEQAENAHTALETRRATGRTLLIVRPSGPFTKTELDYLDSQMLGRLATVQPDGTLQNNPVGFRYNRETATIDIRGFNMSKSQKYRNVANNGRAAFVVDDVLSIRPWRVRCLEIRGSAEAMETTDGAIIRIHPERIISFGIDEPDKDPHELTPDTRDI